MHHTTMFPSVHFAGSIIGPDLSRPSSPLELQNGCVVCSGHLHKVCPYCCSDYSFMDDILGSSSDQTFEEDEDYEDDESDEDNDDSDNSEIRAFELRSPPQDLRIGTGRVMFQKFNQPRSPDTPSSLFPPSRAIVTRFDRFVRRNKPTELLIYTDGACLDNGHANARAGCGFVFSSVPNPASFCTFRLENKGPTGEVYKPTSNRAELRAVIAALRYRAWDGEGFRSIVIATDSDYVVNGATRWVRSWLKKGWKTSIGAPVKNKDLWQVLLGEAERWSERGVKIQFWWIPRYLNTEADLRARNGANQQEVPDGFTEISGMLW